MPSFRRNRFAGNPLFSLESVGVDWEKMLFADQPAGRDRNPSCRPKHNAAVRRTKSLNAEGQREVAKSTAKMSGVVESSDVMMRSSGWE